MHERHASSDRDRSGRPLRHLQRLRLDEPLALEGGGKLEGVEVAYETWGRLDAARSNAVLVCHAISGDSHAARHDPEDDPGWWDVVVGPGRPIDTERWFVICPNVLGGCRGSTGPASTNPATGRAFGADFPAISVADMVECQRRLLDRLGIDRLRTVVGGSLGGHQALCWAERHPERVASVMAVATSARLTSQATAFDVVGRSAIAAGPERAGLAIARMLGHVTYLSRESMAGRFDSDRLAQVSSYLDHQGARFVERFDPQSYVTLSLAMDRFDVDPRTLPASCRWLVLSFSSDWLFPPEQSRELVDGLAPRGARVTYCNVPSRCGHDAFLLRDDVALYGELIRGFLESRTAAAAPRTAEGAPLEPGLERIEELLPAGGSVLDVGCGEGALLARLRERGCTPLAGIEPAEGAVLAAVGRGLDVIHAEADAGLACFAPGQFDHVVLTRELHRAPDVESTLRAALRVGRRVLVGFANAAGAVPGPGSAPRWHEGPPERTLCISDLRAWAAASDLRVERLVGLDAHGRELDPPFETRAAGALALLAPAPP